MVSSLFAKQCLTNNVWIILDKVNSSWKYVIEKISILYLVRYKVRFPINFCCIKTGEILHGMKKFKLKLF